MWRNAAHQDKHPLPIPVLPQQLCCRSRRIVAGVHCHTGVPKPCPCQECRWGARDPLSRWGQPRLCVLPGSRGHGAEQVPAEHPAVLRPRAVGSHHSRTLIQLF